MPRTTEPTSPHPLEPWLLEQVRAHYARGGDRFDELNVAGWMLSAGSTGKPLWAAAKTVALHVLSVCEQRRVIKRTPAGWYTLVEPNLTTRPG